MKQVVKVAAPLALCHLCYTPCHSAGCPEGDGVGPALKEGEEAFLGPCTKHFCLPLPWEWTAGETAEGRVGVYD